jgi:hypothetical protein
MINTQLLSLLISALGGAVGALILRSLLKFIVVFYYRVKPLAIYSCANNEPSKAGELRHTWGQRIYDPKSSSKYAWEYGTNRIERPGESITGEHTIYGPYINDFGKPGFYRIRFRIRAMNLPKTDESIISLDVVQARFGTEAVLRLLGQRILKARELSKSYKYFDVVCFASGTGVYEYRCAVFGDAESIKGKKILFDNIKIYSHPSLLEIL